MKEQELTSSDRAIFDIKLDRLHEQWVTHCHDYRKASEDCADARKEWEEAKAAKAVAEDELKEAAALADLQIRRGDPKTHGLDKFTESSIFNLVITGERYKKAQQITYEKQSDVIAAKHALDLSESLVGTLDHRKPALQDIVRLRLASYF